MAESKNNNEESKGLDDDPSLYSGKKIPLRIIHSFEEQAEYERQYSISLTPLERMFHLRKMIDAAYRMYGFDPNHLPQKHKIAFK